MDEDIKTRLGFETVIQSLSLFAFMVFVLYFAGLGMMVFFKSIYVIVGVLSFVSIFAGYYTAIYTISYFYSRQLELLDKEEW